MGYVVLARKYRPQTFEDMIAQEHITRTLQNAVRMNRVAQGYLFCGPRGTGKTTTARILAKAINCVTGPTPTPCGDCDICREITTGSSLDVKEIDAASNTGVDDIRALREVIMYAPARGRMRVFIIDEVHRLSGAAFDALLKTLEEPPPHVLFIFATTDPLKVPDTIISRTQRHDFRRVPPADLQKHLQKIMGMESIGIEPDALALICRKGDGSVRDSLSLLDQTIAYASGTIDTRTVTDALGLVDRALLLQFVGAVAASENAPLLRIIRDARESGVDGSDFAADLNELFRVMLILKADRHASEPNDYSAAEIEEMAKLAEKFSTGDLLQLLAIGSQLLLDLKSGLDERMLLQIAGLKMAALPRTSSIEALIELVSSGSGFTAPPANPEKKSDNIAASRTDWTEQTTGPANERLTLRRTEPPEASATPTAPAETTHVVLHSPRVKRIVDLVQGEIIGVKKLES